MTAGATGNQPLSEPGANVAAAVLSATRRFPDRVAFDLDGRLVRYGELEAMIRSAAARLSGLRLRPGAPVAQVTGNRVEAFALQMACFRCGHPAVMVHPKVGAGDQARILSDAEPAAIVIDPDLDLGDHVENAVPDSRVYSHGPGPSPDFWSLPDDREPTPPTGRSDLARIAYTGGTTGRPKGVLLSHGAMLSATLLASCEIEWPTKPRFVVSTPISHAGGTLIPTILMRGGTVLLRPSFDPAAMIADMDHGRANSAFLVPTMMYTLIDWLSDRRRKVQGLELLLYGASAIAPYRLGECLELFGDVLNQSYGQTEAPNTITILKASEHRGELLASSGMPYAGVTVTIRDQSGIENPTGVVGEVCVRGPQLMDGYRGLPDATEDALRDGWLWTGDLAWMDDRGYVFHVGRSKDVIISGGVNVYPVEIEEVLCSHDDVLTSVVVGVPDDHWGEAVKAVVVARQGGVSIEELRALIRARKGPASVPKTFELVDSLPLTPLGKPDRAKVRAGYWLGRERMVN